MARASVGVLALNWALLAAAMAGAVSAGIWTSGLLLGMFLPESMAAPLASETLAGLTIFDYLASVVAGGWIGYVAFFVLWDCSLKRIGTMLNAGNPIRLRLLRRK